MMGTRGVPAAYGGFETAIEEIGQRLAADGCQVTVYCRSGTEAVDRPRSHLGMDLVWLPAVRSRAIETLSHSVLSAGREVLRGGHDVVFLFNAANSPVIPALHARRAPVAVHVDGLEWMRTKWGGVGRRYYRLAEALSVRWADALIADAEGIGEYYRTEFGASTEPIAYGTQAVDLQRCERLPELDLAPDGYHLVVARFEPENHVLPIVQGFARSGAELPLVVVGGAPYSDDYIASVHAAAGGDARIRFVGPVWDQELLDQLYVHARTYLHGHSVGGTNPSLLRAMGASTAVIAYDVSFNRDVLGEHGRVFVTVDDVARELEQAEQDPADAKARGALLRERATERYDWDRVAEQYMALAGRLAGGWTRRGEVSGRRRRAGDAGAVAGSGFRVGAR
jgi:glycosyltransferase involved in cell wall biosynthesis